MLTIEDCIATQVVVILINLIKKSLSTEMCFQNRSKIQQIVRQILYVCNNIIVSVVYMNTVTYTINYNTVYSTIANILIIIILNANILMITI